MFRYLFPQVKFLDHILVQIKQNFTKKKCCIQCRLILNYLLMRDESRKFNSWRF